MKSIDEQIRNALAEEDQKLIDEIDDEAGLFDMMGMTFRGKQAWITWYMYALGFATFVLGLYFLDRYFAATDIKTSLTWALGIMTCLSVLIVIKVVGWQQMMKMELMREIKRLEMRVMLAAGRGENDG